MVGRRGATRVQALGRATAPSMRVFERAAAATGVRVRVFDPDLLGRSAGTSGECAAPLARRARPTVIIYASRNRPLESAKSIR